MVLMMNDQLTDAPRFTSRAESPHHIAMMEIILVSKFYTPFLINVRFIKPVLILYNRLGI